MACSYYFDQHMVFDKHIKTCSDEVTGLFLRTFNIVMTFFAPFKQALL